MATAQHLELDLVSLSRYARYIVTLIVSFCDFGTVGCQSFEDNIPIVQSTLLL